MTKHSVVELEGALLDAAVAQAEGKPWEIWRSNDPEVMGCMEWIDSPGDPCGDHYPYNPSTDWQHGGPIIEREKITIVWTPASGQWSAYWNAETTADAIDHKQDGPTPLIAAMRCYVRNKIGEEIELPKAAFR